MVTMDLRVVVDVDELDIPGSMLSFGFIENPVRVEFLTGEIVVLLSNDLIISSDTVIMVLYPVIAQSKILNRNLTRLKLNEI